MGAPEFFTTEWAGLARGLKHWLARRRVPPQEIDDIVQETALRLLRHWDGIDHDRPLEPFARTVALNVWRDRVGAAASRDVIGTPHDTASAEDVERRVLARIELDRTLGALGRLPAGQRALIRDATAGALDEQAPVAPRSAAERMALMRARKALAAALGAAVAILVGVRTRYVRRSTTGTAGVGAVVAAVVLLPGVRLQPADTGPALPPPAVASPAGVSTAPGATAPGPGPAAVRAAGPPRLATAPRGGPRPPSADGLPLPSPPQAWIELPSVMAPGGRKLTAGHSPQQPVCASGPDVPPELRCGTPTSTVGLPLS